jgi:L-serine dehydratase
MGPRRAAQQYQAAHPAAAAFRATLYGSLAATGKGHLTDRVIHETLAPLRVEIIWRPAEHLPLHPNGLELEALDQAGLSLARAVYYSVGGGALLGEGEAGPRYPLTTAAGLLAECERRGYGFWNIVEDVEGAEIWPFLDGVWTAMTAAITRGLAAGGALPGGLALPRKAPALYRRAASLQGEFQAEACLAAYAYAVSEENASGGEVVTAPTCGSCGVVPAVLHHLQTAYRFGREDVLRALATAGLFGDLVKHNGSISGAMVGCQGEVGVACAMAAAAAAQLLGGTPRQVEYAAEMGLEHHLGLTCDPVLGLVQIPCIERNAHAATRALSCARFALLSDGLHRISFDDVVAVMLETGRALPSHFKETAQGGLAEVYARRLAAERTENG